MHNNLLKVVLSDIFDKCLFIIYILSSSSGYFLTFLMYLQQKQKRKNACAKMQLNLTSA